ncbi:glycoside hydrolase family 6 protein [Glycomyces buryatensis]|uniref:Glucanase n=1 Tax=Glycomyces buryatensis TaxID=2570927 RepID=A0A4V4HRM5_9ACTN|nr:glycoside hydrolase family 6 protein [Glycomyces buryatensis]THV38436.1 endoglucanase [Glycomyces buryatensis]
MNRRKRLAAIAAGTAAAAIAAASAAFLLSPGAGAETDDAAQSEAEAAQAQPLWANPNTQAARWVAENGGDSRAALIGERIASTAAGTWFTTTNPEGGIEAQISAVVDGAAADGAAPIMVVYNIPNRDCGGASGGGASSHEEYRGWIDDIASVLSGPAYIVLEPDVLPHDCYGDSERAQINQSMEYAARTLKAADPEAHVYIDIGHSNWLSADEAASALNAAGIASADGFSINTSNYRTTEEASAYAAEIRSIVGSDKGAVIDTSRNGNGPLGEEWCDPQGRAIGAKPTTATGIDGIDAFLWVKLPGEADGCAGAAGQFIPDLAYSLADAAGPDWPGEEPTEDPTDEPSEDPTGGTTDGDCSAEFVVVSRWNGGWQANVDVTAGTTALSGWTLTWDWPGDQAISSSWNVDISQSGKTVTASDVGWNGSIASTETMSAFGMVGSGSPQVPAIECAA